jgi:hypothetical protein
MGNQKGNPSNLSDCKKAAPYLVVGAVTSVALHQIAPNYTPDMIKATIENAHVISYYLKESAENLSELWLTAHTVETLSKSLVILAEEAVEATDLFNKMYGPELIAINILALPLQAITNKVNNKSGSIT